MCIIHKDDMQGQVKNRAQDSSFLYIAIHCTRQSAGVFRGRTFVVPCTVPFRCGFFRPGFWIAGSEKSQPFPTDSDRFLVDFQARILGHHHLEDHPTASNPGDRKSPK